MATTQVNLAVTKDGETYNKLSRPDDYLTSTTPLLPPLSPVTRPAAQAYKRKRGRDDGTNGSKRIRDDYDLRAQLPGGDDDASSMGEPTDEALAYLRSVRSEASMIPTLLAVPAGNELDEAEQRSLPCDATANMDGAIFNDGVWIALDAETQTDDDAAEPDERHSTLRPQQSYYELLLVRFLALRTTLQASSFPRVNKTALESYKKPDSRQAWLDMVDTGYPTSQHIGQLDESGLFQALEACSASLGRSMSISREKSCWIWTLLALASDAGTLNNNLISKIRHLGLQAGRLGARLREDAAHRDDMVEDMECDKISDVSHDGQDESMQDAVFDIEHTSVAETSDGQSLQPQGNHGNDATNQGPEATLAVEDNGTTQPALDQARARLLAQLGDRLVPSGGIPQEEAEEEEEEEGEVPGVLEKNLEDEKPVDDLTDWNTKATIDMILTVVAECYGQRDLLENRATW